PEVGALDHPRHRTLPRGRPCITPIPAAERPRRRQTAKRLSAFLPRHGKCYPFFLLLSADIDVELLSFLNRPGTPWLDSLMGAASNRGVLLAIAALAAIYRWLKSPHRALAAVLLWAAIGAADLISVRVVKPQVARPRPCNTDPVHVVYPLGCGSGLSFPSSHASDTAAAAAVFGWAAPRLSTLGVAMVVVVGVSRALLGRPV